MTLSNLGWDAAFEAAFQDLTDVPDGCLPFRVAREDKTQYRLLGAAGAFAGLLLGRLQHDPDALHPAVGDWVAAHPVDDQTTLVHAVLPRRSVFTRHRAGRVTEAQVVAANIDTAFLVSGLDGDFNLRRIERYAVQAWNSGATPVVVLNKADADPEAEAHRAAAAAAAPGLDVHLISAHTGQGLDALAPYLTAGQTVAFLGSSGVGKTTLVNRLLGTTALATQAVRADDSRGRHTTTYRALFALPTGGLVIDTPGMRELQLWADADALDGAFTDVDALASECRFRDCTHDTEPGCAVQEALDEGLLAPDRFANYQKMQRELAYLARQVDEAAARKAHQREKKFGKLVRNITRNNPKQNRRR